MKKVLLFLLILLIAFGGYIYYDNYYNKGIPKLLTEEEKIDIDELTIYGTHLNLHGKIINDNNLDLVLYDGNFKSYKINLSDNGFNMANEINNGIYLEDIPVGKYYAFLRSTNKDENDKDIYKYYVLNNTTQYKETVYYTFSNVGNKIVINTDDGYGTLTFDVSKNNDKDIYDVVIDAGHGGMDSGANKNGYREADFTMKLANDLKIEMEEYGVKVKMTRTENQLTLNEKLPDYGIHGRAVVNHEVHAKYVFSIHLNSNGSQNVHGLEVYTAANINYDFAKELAKNIVTNANTSYSSNKINRMFDGIYTRTFTESEIANSKKEVEDKGGTAYNITNKANYYFMIRETGGIMTGAYVDSRNQPKVLENPYYNSNVGSESYLLELGYLTNNGDLNNINSNMAKYTDAIANTFKGIFVKDFNYNLNDEN